MSDNKPLILAPEGFIAQSHTEIIDGKEVRVIDKFDLTGVSIVEQAAFEY